MTDVTSTPGTATQDRKDPTKPAAPTTRLAPDTGSHSPPSPTSAGEAKTFGSSATPDGAAAAGGVSPTPAQLASDADALLRASLETIRVKAEDLRRQTTDWAGVRGDQAREIIDEWPAPKG